MAITATLFTDNEDLVDAWADAFLDGLYASEDVHIVLVDSMEDLREHDVLVIPGNSYGILSSGFELKAKERFGEALEETLQRVITKYFLGELPVGSAAPVHFDDEEADQQFRTLIYAPVMRIPQLLNGTENPFLATLAALQVINSNRVSFERDDDLTVAIPCMAGDPNQVIPTIMASQMKTAWDMLQSPTHPEAFGNTLTRPFLK